MKTKLIILLLTLQSFVGFGQSTSAHSKASDSLFRPNYPEGIYRTKEDFMKKVPFQKIEVVPKSIMGFTKTVLSSIEHNCFFFYGYSDEKITDAFAISYKGHLYFKVNAILKNRNKKDRSQSHQFPNSFVRVILGGENYLYTEADLANAWAKGLAYGAVGGGAGAVLANNAIYGKGIVWDFKEKEFNIFKNCDDFNEFITDKDSEGVQECDERQPDTFKVRAAIDRIK